MAGLVWSGAASAAGIAVSGKQIAERWCSTCHLVGPKQETAAAVGTPSFMAISKKYGDSVDMLAGFLADPHPPMPSLSLTRQEINDLIAYIGSLDKGAEKPEADDAE
ncbi:c-type cytochrome [Methyloligella solikamskensis]|uniref:C-type cytochrome n=1 Tax=Methyloligella solikamskensis TaxID=1177756 RepID=A0ABW3JAC5_9HYPH